MSGRYASVTVAESPWPDISPCPLELCALDAASRRAITIDRQIAWNTLTLRLKWSPLREALCRAPVALARCRKTLAQAQSGGITQSNRRNAPPASG